ncbi:hypothetical protein HK096_008422 [Nowakowskiella sp. JEL0078]|nr:hypothetical protein HK096_008422 [Nowakowskiella sp. JEL0078]
MSDPFSSLFHHWIEQERWTRLNIFPSSASLGSTLKTASVLPLSIGENIESVDLSTTPEISSALTKRSKRKNIKRGLESLNEDLEELPTKLSKSENCNKTQFSFVDSGFIPPDYGTYNHLPYECFHQNETPESVAEVNERLFQPTTNLTTIVSEDIQEKTHLINDIEPYGAWVMVDESYYENVVSIPIEFYREEENNSAAEGEIEKSLEAKQNFDKQSDSYFTEMIQGENVSDNRYLAYEEFKKQGAQQLEDFRLADQQLAINKDCTYIVLADRLNSKLDDFEKSKFYTQFSGTKEQLFRILSLEALQNNHAQKHAALANPVTLTDSFEEILGPKWEF